MILFCLLGFASTCSPNSKVFPPKFFKMKPVMCCAAIFSDLKPIENLSCVWCHPFQDWAIDMDFLTNSCFQFDGTQLCFLPLAQPAQPHRSLEGRVLVDSAKSFCLLCAMICSCNCTIAGSPSVLRSIFVFPVSRMLCNTSLTILSSPIPLHLTKWQNVNLECLSRPITTSSNNCPPGHFQQLHNPSISLANPHLYFVFEIDVGPHVREL